MHRNICVKNVCARAWLGARAPRLHPWQRRIPLAPPLRPPLLAPPPLPRHPTPLPHRPPPPPRQLRQSRSRPSAPSPSHRPPRTPPPPAPPLAPPRARPPGRAPRSWAGSSRRCPPPPAPPAGCRRRRGHPSSSPSRTPWRTCTLALPTEAIKRQRPLATAGPEPKSRRE
eukprot:scaffold11167_cov125-Isochrysis_galbana.AAC.4